MPSIDTNTVTALADVLGGAAKAGASSNQFRDALRIALENSKLARDKFATAAPDARMQTGFKASAATHAKPSSVQWGGPGSGLRGEVPQFSGGRKSIYDAVADPQTKQLLDMVMRDTNAAQKRGGLTGGGADTAMPTIGESSFLDKALGTGAFASSALGALGKGGSGSGGSIDLGKLVGDIFGDKNFGTPGGVSGNYNGADYQGINRDTGLWDPNMDPRIGYNPENPAVDEGISQGNLTGYADPTKDPMYQQPAERDHTDYGTDEGWAW